MYTSRKTNLITATKKQPKPLARYYLAGLLGLMALGQLLSWPQFIDITGTYQIGAAALPFAVIIFILEVTAAVGLLQKRTGIRRYATYAALAATILWTLMAIQAFSRGLALDNCGCFGQYLGQPLRWWILLEDTAFVALAIYVHRQYR